MSLIQSLTPSQLDQLLDLLAECAALGATPVQLKPLTDALLKPLDEELAEFQYAPPFLD